MKKLVVLGVVVGLLNLTEGAQAYNLNASPQQMVEEAKKMQDYELTHGVPQQNDPRFKREPPKVSDFFRKLEANPQGVSYTFSKGWSVGAKKRLIQISRRD